MPITTRNLLDQYTEILQKIYGKHLKKVILYGSYARGDYRDDSDIDIMILLDLSDMDIKQYRHELFALGLSDMVCTFVCDCCSCHASGYNKGGDLSSPKEIHCGEVA